MENHDVRIHDTLVIHGPVETSKGNGEMAGSTDLENLMILALARHERVVREVLSLTDDFKVKYIATGTTYRVTNNEVPVDVAGGPFDQHGFPENWRGTVRTSIDAVLEASQLRERYLGFMYPFFNAVSRNDATGESVAKETEEMRELRLASATPHTKTDLRTLVKGWNKLYKYTPKTIERLAELAFRGVYALLEDKFTKELDALTAEATEKGWSSVELDEQVAAIEKYEMPQRRDDEVFMLSRIVSGLGMYLDEKGEGDYRTLSAEQKQGIVKWFSDRCALALKAWEQEWLTAKKDFDADKGRYEMMYSPVYIRRGKDASGAMTLDQHTGKVMLVAGQSESDRFPELLRAHAREVYYDKLGGDITDPEKRYAAGKRRYHREEGRPPVVVIHFRKSTGKFFVSSETEGGFAMHDVAAAIRIADLVRRGARIPRSAFKMLIEQGGVMVSDGRGKPFIPFYFPFPTGFGNALITNPFMPPTVLGVEDIWDLVRGVIQNKIVFPEKTLACKGPEPKCQKDCRYYWFNHAGCNEFRLSLGTSRVRLTVVR